LRISDAAAESLAKELVELQFDGVVTVNWVTDPKTVCSFWEVGYYNRNDVPIQGIQEIRGVTFVFGQDPISARLNGMTLHEDDNGYVVKGD
jgi:hypothetical protein